MKILTTCVNALIIFDIKKKPTKNLILQNLDKPRIVLSFVSQNHGNLRRHSIKGAFPRLVVCKHVLELFNHALQLGFAFGLAALYAQSWGGDHELLHILHANGLDNRGVCVERIRAPLQVRSDCFIDKICYFGILRLLSISPKIDFQSF